METRIVKRMSHDTPPEPYWVVEETVTPQGHTIEWGIMYETEAAAQLAIAAKS